MKTITDDPVGFIETGGWTFLEPDSEGEDAANDETEDEEDDAYEPTDSDVEGKLSKIKLNLKILLLMNYLCLQRMKTQIPNIPKFLRMKKKTNRQMTLAVMKNLVRIGLIWKERQQKKTVRKINTLMHHLNRSIRAATRVASNVSL
jgi:hypothetical protein